MLEEQTQTEQTENTCMFNGREIANGETITAYNSETVLAGSTCDSETRTCENGAMQGDSDYMYDSCAVQVATTTNTTCNQAGGPTNSTYKNINNTITINAGETIPNCEWECNTNYTKDGDTCIANTRKTECSGDNGDETYAGTPKFTQTWDGTSWTPATKTWTYTTNSTPQECEFTCASGKEWNSDDNKCEDKENETTSEYDDATEFSLSLIPNQLDKYEIGGKKLIITKNNPPYILFTTFNAQKIKNIKVEDGQIKQIKVYYKNLFGNNKTNIIDVENIKNIYIFD